MMVHQSFFEDGFTGTRTATILSTDDVRNVELQTSGTFSDMLNHVHSEEQTESKVAMITNTNLKRRIYSLNFHS